MAQEHPDTRVVLVLSAKRSLLSETCRGRLRASSMPMGLALSPGFVDPHSHVDLNILVHPLAENMIMQGITTFIGCNCGHCRAPLSGPEYATRWNEYLGLGPEDCVESDWHTFGEFLARVESVRSGNEFCPTRRSWRNPPDCDG